MFLFLRINRNIVECKYIVAEDGETRLTRINRNIVECKSVSDATAIAVIFELIETLWNVNGNWPLKLIASCARN